METVRARAREWVRAHYPSGARHLLRAEEWAQQLQPDASEAVLLAALLHDMERAFPASDSPRPDFSRGIDDPLYNRAHSERSARIVSSYLQEQETSQECIKHVARLIRAHEYGGEDDENLVQAADSLSFLEVNIDNFVDKLGEDKARENAEVVRAKVRWMYERIQLPQARDLARPLYEEAMSKAESRLL
ncbi:hypothetical protein KSF_101560 [Reticulibacter mediterranei]|uniref:HD/PDEase domain-containing protein n=1 Tax=Reticulibacter mediterranei TaxID=2778369 RepID=A0A8J3IX47_9CHLR|nr:DUF4202 family protein [Reticulibacter mediterranei]GHP00109.1 hypothetical protein KSF_101560 [Reticulibacter mediterranei]